MPSDADSLNCGDLTRRILGIIAAAAGILGAAAYAAAFLLADDWWVPELITHFRVQAAAAVAACALLALAARSWIPGTAAGIAAAWLAWPLAAFEFASPVGAENSPASDAGTPITLIAANLLISNPDSEPIANLLERDDIDVALLMEIGAARINDLSEVLASYPHQLANPQEDPWGILLASKLPLTDAEILTAPSGAPTVRARVTLAETSFLIIGAHPPPPSSASGAADRNDDLAWLADLVAAEVGPVILAGDLNCTPFSPVFQAFIEASGLRDSAAGFGFHATWRPNLPGLGIPIDHILVTPDITTLDRKVGPPIGSDHQPVTAMLSMP